MTEENNIINKLDIVYYDKRNSWLEASDQELFSQCRCDFFKSMGKGGQKRNKTSSAVRLTHLPSNIVVSADEFRSQHDNRHLALKKLRVEIGLQCRSKEFPDVDLQIGKKNPLYGLKLALLCDILTAQHLNIKCCAKYLSISSNQFTRLLFSDSNLWQYVQSLREQAGLSRFKRP